MWRLGGLEKDVVLYSQPKVHVRNFKFVSTLDDLYIDGAFRLTVNLVNHYESIDFDIDVEYELIDVNHDCVTIVFKTSLLKMINRLGSICFESR